MDLYYLVRLFFNLCDSILSEIHHFPFSYFIVTIATPDNQILESYLTKFGDIFNDDNTLQPSDSSDTAEDAGVSDIGD